MSFNNLIQNKINKFYNSLSEQDKKLILNKDDQLRNRIKEKFPGKNFKVAHNADSFTIDFKPAGQTQNSGSGESTTIFRSFAEITVKNMRTFSGDVHRIKTFVNETTPVISVTSLYINAN